MSGLLIALGVFGGLVIILIFWGVGIYNKLIKFRNMVESSWADIDVQLKKRYNLIPSLVETVKGYAQHEKGVFEKVTQARSAVMSASGPEERANKENMFKDTIKSLFAVAEAYPELKANTNFLQLQQELGNIEDDIESARRYYNAIVRDYNTTIESVPSNIIAGMFAFKQKEFFELENPEHREPIRPDFS